MAALKTKATVRSVADFLAGIEDVPKRVDAQVLIDTMAKVSGVPATMWGPSIIGFGTYHYRYESGHEGAMCRIGFSPRKANFALYLGGFPEREALLARLGKYKTAKSCIYLGRLSDVDMGVLEAMFAAAWAKMAADYPL